MPSLVQDLASNLSLAIGVTKTWVPLLDPVFIEMSRHFWYNDSSSALMEGLFRPRDPLETLRDTVHYLSQNGS